MCDLCMCLCPRGRRVIQWYLHLFQWADGRVQQIGFPDLSLQLQGSVVRVGYSLRGVHARAGNTQLEKRGKGDEKKQTGGRQM